jgi:hypothetical protein
MTPQSSSTAAPAKVLTGQLDESLALLAQNLSVDKRSREQSGGGPV